MGASTPCCNSPSTATKTVQYKNKQYDLFKTGARQMENLINGVINNFNTTPVNTPLCCDPNPPHKSLPIYFDLVSRFNDLPHKSDINLSVNKKKLHTMNTINPDYLKKLNLVSETMETTSLSKDEKNNKYILTDSYSNLPHELDLNVSPDVFKNKLEMIVDSVNSIVVHQSDHISNGIQYEPLLISSTDEFTHPLYCGPHFTLPQKRKDKTMYLEQNVDDYGDRYWTSHDVVRSICGVTSQIKYKTNYLKPINIRISIDVSYF
eukprot:124318_1